MYSIGTHTLKAATASVNGAEFYHEVRGSGPELRERMLGNADTFFFVEIEGFVSYVPDDRVLAGVKVPVLTAAGTGSRDVYYFEATEWVAKQLRTELQEIPGGHTPYFDRPEDLATAIRPFLRAVS